eukprot:jgi/Mesvir1/25616/Mv01842-RA.1
MSSDGSQTQPSIIRRFATAAISASIAEIATISLDTAKVRLQLQSLASASVLHSTPKYRNPFQTIYTIARDEGAAAPFVKGIVPGLHRQFLFTGVRLGLYGHVREFFCGPGDNPPLLGKALSAAVTSTLGICLGQPSDVVKVQMQADTYRMGGRPSAGATPSAVAADSPTAKLFSHSKPRYSGVFDAYKTIFVNEGPRGLYKGFTANLIRNVSVSTVEIVGYDQIKSSLMALGAADGMPLHVTSGLLAGFCAVLVGSPFDVISTRLMVLRKHLPGTPAPPYTNTINTAIYLVRHEGVKAFYKGFIPNFARVGSFNVCLWVAYERVKLLLGS